MAWALLVVIGKYQVVEDLKDSDESEDATLFLFAYYIGIQKKTNTNKTDGPMGYNWQQKK